MVFKNISWIKACLNIRLDDEYKDQALGCRSRNNEQVELESDLQKGVEFGKHRDNDSCG